MKKMYLISLIVFFIFVIAGNAYSAYHHEGEDDSPNFLAAYPDKAGTKLDQCALCHTGSSYVNKYGETVSVGSCQTCHDITEYGAVPENIGQTLNPYGLAYYTNGQSQQALTAIEDLDSDLDGYSNIAEITAIRLPGDPNDDPSKVPAPSRVYTLAQLEAMPAHTQFMLMNTSRSGDFYAEYTGVPMEKLLTHAGIKSEATNILVYAPDGWSNNHPILPDQDPSAFNYHVTGTYPAANYYYDPEADFALNLDGWSDYSAPSCTGRKHLDFIYNPNGLKLLLAYKREGEYMEPGYLNIDNKLDGEGPFRVVPPQLIPNAPDQSSKSSVQDVIWPYVNEWDHNAGSASRSATIIKVEPLPEGTTDIDYLEIGWNYVDEGKIIIYGAIDVDIPVNPDPADSTVGSTDTVLSWTPVAPPSGVTVLYDVYFGTESNPTTVVSTGQAGATYTPESLTDGILYYWRVVAKYSDQSQSSSATWSFTARDMGTISGKVYTSITTPLTGSHMGIVGATVTLVETGQTAVTDTTGIYTFTHVPTGTYSVLAQKPLFKDATLEGITIDTAGGQISNQDIDMATRALLGDVNGDGRFGLSDVINILQVLSGL